MFQHLKIKGNHYIKINLNSAKTESARHIKLNTKLLFSYSYILPFGISVGKILINTVSPKISPQTTVCTTKVHTLPLVGTSVQVTVVLVVVVGQLPQFDVRML